MTLLGWFIDGQRHTQLTHTQTRIDPIVHATW